MVPPFLDVALLGDPALLALQPTVLSLVVHARLRDKLPEQLQLVVERIFADPQASGHLPDRIPEHRDLMHHIPLELTTLVACPHVRLLGQK